MHVLPRTTIVFSLNSSPSYFQEIFLYEQTTNSFTNTKSKYRFYDTHHTRHPPNQTSITQCVKKDIHHTLCKKKDTHHTGHLPYHTMCTIGHWPNCPILHTVWWMSGVWWIQDTKKVLPLNDFNVSKHQLFLDIAILGWG